MKEKKETPFKDDSLEQFRPIPSSKCLFRATLDQININLKFSYTPKTVVPSQSLLASGAVTHLPSTQNHFVNPEQLKHQKMFALYQDDVDQIISGQIKGQRGFSKIGKSNNQIDLAKKQADLRRALQSYEQNNDDENIGLKSNQIKCSKRFRKNQKKIWKMEKKDREKYNDQIFESQESEPESQQQLNVPQKKNTQRRIISIKEAKSQYKQYMSQNDRKPINQRVIAYQNKQAIEKKKKRREGDHPKKLNLSILQGIDENGYIKALKSDDEQESLKPHSEDQQLKLRTERNRRIGVYIKRTLRAAKTRGGLVIRQLLISVLKNYEQQLNCIKDQQKRNKRFDCLRRRIYQSLSVLSAVGIIDKQKKEVNDKQKINLKGAENQSTRAKQREKQELLARIKEKKMRIKFLKQKYFDAITRLRVIKCLDKRNNGEVQRENQKIIFPFKIIVANRENMTLETIKSSPRLAKIDIVRIKATSIRPIHSIDMFILLRRILHLPSIQDCVKIDESLAKQYLESTAKEDQYDKNKQMRLRLIQKMKQRKSIKQAKQTKENEKGRLRGKERQKGVKGNIKQRQKRDLEQQQYVDQNKKQEAIKKLKNKLVQKHKKRLQIVEN